MQNLGSLYLSYNCPLCLSYICLIFVLYAFIGSHVGGSGVPQMAEVLQTLAKMFAICVAFCAWNVHANGVMNNLRIHCGLLQRRSFLNVHELGYEWRRCCLCREENFLMFMNSATRREDDLPRILYVSTDKRSSSQRWSRFLEGLKLHCSCQLSRLCCLTMSAPKLSA